MYDRVKKEIAEPLSQMFTGPLLFHYVWWVLWQAKSRNIHMLYFLARDGYLLWKIAQQFCDTFHLPIECRYLYASRASLRMPTYHLIGKEAMELLTLGGYQVTLFSLLRRAELTSEERTAVYNDCGMEQPNENRLLTRSDLDKWRKALLNSKVFYDFIFRKSKAAYGNAIGYFRQEGLFDQREVALVDSGWTGSMQRSLRQLLQSAGFNGGLIGFYFGMYAVPKSPEDGTYLTWYFNHNSSPHIKIPFCNNLFECLLSAPHGMTTGYCLRGGAYEPEQLPAPQGAELDNIHENIGLVLEYVQDRLKELDFVAFCRENALRETRKRIRRYMAHPTRAEATYYGRFLFCDDTTEAYRFSLADKSQIHALKGYSIPARVWRRLFSKGNAAVPELYWPYGTIAFLPCWKRWWYRWNVYVWEWLRYTLC